MGNSKMKNLTTYKEQLLEALIAKQEKDGIIDRQVVEELGRVSSELYLIEQFKKVAA